LDVRYKEQNLSR